MRSILYFKVIALALFTFLTGAVAAQTLYKANWVDPTSNITINADLSITRAVGASTYNGGAVGDNILPAGQNGFVQVTYVASTSNRFFMALNILEEGVSYTSSQYAIQIDGAQARVFQYDVGAIATTTAAAGDVFKIERVGTSVTFYKNADVLITLNGIQSQFSLRPEAILRSGTMPPVYCSFDRKVLAKPTIQLPTYTNNNGVIAITPEGGQAPFTYSWTPIELQPTSSISGKPRGIYSVTVTDAVGREGTATYELGYEMAWKNLVNTQINANNTLQAVTGTDSWEAGAAAANVLPANTNGWVEFIMPELTKTAFAIGLATMDRGTTYTPFPYSIYVHPLGYVKVFENNVDRGSLTSVVKGDRFRITRNGTSIIYSRNDIPFRTVTNVTASPEYFVDVAIHAPAGPLPLVTASFPPKLTLGATLVPVNDNNTGGSVTVNVKGALGTPKFLWTTGETSATLSNKGQGTYTVTVTDDLGQTATKTFYLGYAAQWTNRINLRVNENATVTKTLSNVSAWDTGALSANRLLAGENGDVSFTVDRVSPSDVFMVGLTSYNIDAAYNSMDYCFYFLNDGTVSVREKAANPGISLLHQEDNIYRIERKDLYVRYYVNEQILRTVTLADNNKELYADVSIKAASAPRVLTSFNYVPRTLYAVKNGNWTGPDVWSLSEGGTSSGITPVYGDNVRIKGYAVAITGEVECKSIQIIAPSTNTNLTVDGAAAVLTVKEHVKVKGEDNQEPVSAFLVKNLAKFKVQ
ncbi:hypothetical protein KK062_20060 [Fulvivirgaceae bacterium PWU5]|uniref:Uncharacterized protein n=1 Tax=Dawidia cretensis TaxID=2782350 RepID=A0AAP2GVI4_9BACT|nr:hypothetical protein [Dawidia cretensis]MBT1710550.1 hypothetical protein [Dawidia cretensis]